MQQSQVQSFATAPQPVGARTAKYRSDGTGGNMMHDKRVVKGSTYSSLVQPQQDMAEVQKQREAQRRRLMRANQTKKQPEAVEPVMGRKHMDIQTDSYLEELTERTVEFEAETQTDFLLDRPPSPLFMPAKIGVDVDTQILAGDLFDFDQEVEPVLEVLVGKTLEQSMMEMLEEEELESLRRHQEDFEKRRNAEMLEVQRMEAAEKRRNDELQRRMTQAAAQREQNLSIMKKVVSRSVAAAHMSSLKDRALAQLADAGVFTDTKASAVENVFVPDLLKSVLSFRQEQTTDRMVIANVMESSMKAKLDQHSKVLACERSRLAALDDAERQFRKEKEAGRLRQEAEKQRIAREQEALTKWENWQPDPPPSTMVTGVTTEEPVKALTGDGAEMAIAADKAAELAALLESCAGQEPPKMVMANILDAEDGSKYLDNFRLEDKPEEAPAEAAAAEAAGEE